ncbi:hypothetical protein HS1genome_0574 [Sulfodiicoccus acidiphilus]|uniref:Uncharacterized protein n=1 Tax=Sulfodiicoccus acidiphilus TaxID=1670455 RepID=A0A348B1Y3_9CREN|nr:hypothetical protein HS1genome_0574 [Sulfodiicoccus acidiphilus]GGT94374.1 hypothetical protein GCM10007116_09960 [Sulfodiicoccus acidiphilus]
MCIVMCDSREKLEDRVSETNQTVDLRICPSFIDSLFLSERRTNLSYNIRLILDYEFNHTWTDQNATSSSFR